MAKKIGDLDVVSMQQLIIDKTKQLELARECLLDAAQDKADAIASYDKARTLTILKLRNKIITEFEGEKIENLQANLVLEVSKGICFKECFEKHCYEGIYKAKLSIIEAIKAELNGLQSCNKHLD